MKTRKNILLSLLCLFCLFPGNQANADVRMSFNRTGTDGNSVKVVLTDENGKNIGGATASVICSHAFMPNKGAVTNQILCPNVNGMDQPTIQFTFDIKGLPATQVFSSIGLDIHALNKSGGYQKNTNDKARKFNVQAQVGQSGQPLSTFGNLNDIDIAANVGTEGNVHQLWSIHNAQDFTVQGDYQIVLTITTGSANFGCFFGLSEVTLTSGSPAPQPEDVCPFKTSPAVGDAYACYTLLSNTEQVLALSAEDTLSWTDPTDADDQIWYFVEKNGGYLIVNLKDHRIYSIKDETETIWVVKAPTEEQGFYFLPQATQGDIQTKLTVEGKSAIRFQGVHNAHSRALQVYDIPCGVLGNNYITRLHVTGDLLKPLDYPLSLLSDNQLTHPEGPLPNSEYYTYTEDKATVSAGHNFTVEMQLNAAPVKGLEGFIYFDWNRDGVFESMQTINLAQTSTLTVTAPAVLKEGKSRVRIRLTDNGLKGADDEVTGQIFEWILYLTTANPESFLLDVKANDYQRGTVTGSQTGWNIPCTVKATPKGNATFICWQEGLQTVSVDPSYQFTLNHNTELMAYFSPNTDDVSTAIEEHFAEKNQLIQITAEGQAIKVETQAKIKKVMVFRPNGQLVAQSDRDTLRLADTDTGTFIVKLYTDTHDETAKIIIK